MIDEEIACEILNSKLDFLLPSRFHLKLQRNPFVPTNKKVELQIQTSLESHWKSKEDFDYREQSCQSPTVVNAVKGSLPLFTKLLSNLDGCSNSGRCKVVEDEEVQLVREEKNPVVPPVLPIEIPRTTHEFKDTAAKSFSVLNKKLRVNFADNKKLDAKPPNLFETSSKAAHQSQGFYTHFKLLQQQIVAQFYSVPLAPP